MEVSRNNPIDFFRAKALEATNEQTRENLLSAVDALEAFVGDSEIDFQSFTAEMLGEWASMLLFQGYSPKTVANNALKRIATLYNKAVDEGLAAETDAFRLLRNRLEASATDGVDFSGNSATFDKLHELQLADCEHSGLRLARDVVMFAVYMGGLSFEQLIDYKIDDFRGESDGAAEIVARYARPRNTYLFPLRRGETTEKKARLYVEHLFAAALTKFGLSMAATPTDTAAVLWAYAAVSCGIAPAEVAACIAHCRERVAVTAFVEPAALTPEQIGQIRRQVESTLNRNPERWYAMHLRRGVDYEQLTQRIGERRVTVGQLYYPMEDVVRRVGKRRVFETQPIIAWLVFFRSRVTELNRLFAAVGDLAWGYRYTADRRSAYAAIRDEEVLHYQEAIGTLSDDTALLTDSEVDFHPGDHLIILGGAMNGRHGTFITERTAPGTPSGRTIYRIKLAGGNHANWEVDWDPRLVKKITAEEYNRLEYSLEHELND